MSYGPFQAVGDKVGLSDITIRAAFSRKPITYRTAMRIANSLGIPVESFRIKADKRGCARKSNSLRAKKKELRENYRG